MIRDRRRSALAAIALVALALMTACTPEPAPSPSPSPTGFASEDEAFAAAEATYRAYVDALNAVDLSDPSTFEPVFEQTTGEARSKVKEELTQMHADGWTVGGETEVLSVSPRQYIDASTATLDVCADVSTVTLTDSSGKSKVAGNRPAVQALTATVDLRSPPFVVSSVQGRSDGTPC